MSVVAKGLRKEFLGGTPPSGIPLMLIRFVHYFINEKSCLFKTQSLHIVGVPQFGLPPFDLPQFGLPPSDKLPFKLTLGPLCLWQCF